LKTEPPEKVPLRDKAIPNPHYWIADPMDESLRRFISSMIQETSNDIRQIRVAS